MSEQNNNISDLLESFGFVVEGHSSLVDMIAMEVPDAAGLKPTSAALTVGGHLLELGQVVYDVNKASTETDKVYAATKGVSIWAFSSWVTQNTTAVAAVELPGRYKIFAPIVGALSGIAAGAFLKFGESAVNSQLVAKYIADNPKSPEQGGKLIVEATASNGGIRKVVLSTDEKITQYWDNGSVVATVKQGANGNISQIDTSKGALSYSLNFETGEYGIWNGVSHFQGNLSDTTLSPSANQALQQLIDLYNVDIQAIVPQFDLLSQAPVPTVLSNGWIKLEGATESTYTKNGFTYSQDTAGGFEIKHGAVNAYYKDGVQTVASYDAGTGRSYVLKIAADGTKSFSYSGEPGKVFTFQNFFELPGAAKEAFNSHINTIKGQIGDALDDMYQDNPSLQTAPSHAIFSGQGMNAVPPIPGHKPNVPNGQGEESSKNGETYDLNSETTVTIGGQEYALQRMSGYVDVDSLSNLQLVNIVTGNVASLQQNKNNDVRFQAMGELLERWEANPNAVAANGVTFVETSNGGALSKVLKLGSVSQGSVTFTQQGAYKVQVVEAIGVGTAHDVVQVITHDTIDGTGARSEVIEVIYPENFVFEYAGGYFGGLLANQMAQGNVMKQVIYNSLFTTAGQTAGTFVDFLSVGTMAKAAAKAATLGMDTGVNADIPELSDRFAANLSSALASVVGKAIVNQLTDAVEIKGIGGEVFDVVASTVTVGAVNEVFDFVFKGVSGGAYHNLLKQGFDFTEVVTIKGIEDTIGGHIKASIANALAGYVGGRLAGELIPAESKEAAILGSLGGGIASYFGGSSIGSLITAGSIGGPIGIAIATFLGTIGGTLIGNIFGEDEKTPGAYAKIGYDPILKDYKITLTDKYDGGDSGLAESMGKTVLNAVNHILDLTHGGLRTASHAPQVSIGLEKGQFYVAGFGDSFLDRTYFDRSGDAIEFAALKLLKGFDLVGGHAILMRAWHNSEATTLQGFQEDISVAEAFQTYLLNPTAVLALMMSNPESEAAKQWAAILNRAAELNLHIPSDNDLDGGWGEVLAARGDINPEAIPTLQNNELFVTDPATGQQIKIEHVIGPGYEIIIREGTDGNDHIELVIDGPSITYTDAGPGDDTFIGTNGADIFVGGRGDDTAYGRGGNDWLYGGEGEDELYGEAGEDLIIGGAGNDILDGGADRDIVYGNDGNDTIHASGGNDSIYGGTGNDIVHGDFGDSNVTAYGGAGDDTMYGYGGSTTLDGGTGNDTFILSSPNTANPSNFVRISRGDGNDVVDTSTMNALQNVYVTFDYGIGINELWFSQSGNDLKISVIGEDQSVTIKNWWSDSWVRSKTLIFGSHTETPMQSLFVNGEADQEAFFSFRMSATPTQIQSNFGPTQPTGIYNEVPAFNANLTSVWQALTAIYDYGQGTFTSYTSVAISQNALAVEPFGQIAPYIIRAEDYPTNYIASYSQTKPLIYLGSGSGNADIIAAQYNDKMYGGNGNDHLDGKEGDDIISGGAGNDTIHGEAGNDQLFGGIGDDSIHDQRGGNDVLYGGVGNDLLEATDGNDTLHGDEGNDILDGGSDSDSLFGGAGNDTLYGASENDALNGEAGDDALYGGADNDWLDGGAGNDVVAGDIGDDTLVGGSGYDILLGGEGNDALSGGDGIDNLYGHAGNDTLQGNAGADRLMGGLGNDTLTGGAGADRFVMAIEAASTDTIQDFSVTETGERIDLISFNGVAVDFAAFSQAFTQIDLDTHINLAGNQKIILRNVDKDDLNANHFIGITPVANQAPVIINQSASIVGGQTAVITAAMLSATDADNTANQLVFMMVATAMAGSLKRDGVTLGSFDTFTGQDILDGKLSFQAQSGYTGLNKFDFIVSDGIAVSEKQTFYIASNSIVGTQGHNTGNYEGALIGTGHSDLFHGLAGTDSFLGNDGDDIIYGDSGVTWAYASGGNDIIFGSAGGEESFGRSELYGYEGDDIIYGGSATDSLVGDTPTSIGNDTLNGGAGTDDLYGGLGNDTYLYNLGDGHDTIYEQGGAIDVVKLGKGITKENTILTSMPSGDVDITFINSPNDKLTIHYQVDVDRAYWRIEKIIFDDGSIIDVPLGTFSGDDYIYGDAQANPIYGGDGGDRIWGANGDDLIYGQNDGDTILGEQGDDTVYGGAGNDTIEGMWGDDTLYGDEGDDYLNGSDGNDTIEGGAGTDTIDGGAGIDIVTYLQSSVSVIVSLAIQSVQQNTVGAGLDTLISIENLIGSNYGDTLTGNSADNTIGGMSGVDYVYAGNGNDQVTGDGSNDYLFGEFGNDIISGGDGNDRVEGSDGNDTLSGDAGIDTIVGGNGDDLANGGSDNDTMRGDAGADVMYGDAGDDYLKGGNDNDTLYGGDGIDLILGENGDDIIYGGNSNLSAGTTNQDLRGGAGNDTIYGGDGYDVIRGDTGKDVLRGGLAIDDINGGAGDDQIFGDAGDDVLYGGSGDDVIEGGSGNDTIKGEEGEDSLYGGAGNDDVRGGTDDNIIYGGSGNDVIYGGSTATGDTFSGNDELYGEGDDDFLYAGKGNDKLDGGAGNDNMRGLDGDDTYVMSTGFDYIYDSAGSNDRLLFGYGVDLNDITFTKGADDTEASTDSTDLLISWNSGSDKLEIENQIASTSATYIEKIELADGSAFTFSNYLLWTKGGAGAETITGNASANTILGYAGIDILSGAAGNDEIHGGDDNDTLNGGDNDDLLHGGRGNDIVNGDSGNDIIFGGLGDDELAGGIGDDIYMITSGVETITEADGTDTLKFAPHVSLEYLTFSNTGTDDVTINVGTQATAVVKQQRALAATRVENITFADGFALNFAQYSAWLMALTVGGALSGTANADTLIGGSGVDTLSGNDGIDTIHGGAGNDTISAGIGDDFAHGGSGNDVIRGDAGGDTIYGGDGNDTIYAETDVGSTIVYRDILKAGSGDDTAYAGAGDDDLYGEDGIDTLYGENGIDVIDGGEGGDTIDGGSGNDIIDGGDGNDTILGGSGNDTINGGFGSDNISGNIGDDIISGNSGDDTLNGNAGTDTIYGGAGNDTIYGGTTNTGTGQQDFLYGEDGDDIIKGQDGDDIINGGAGVDTLYGESGVDSLYGGADGDVFMFLAANAFSELDLIKDFVKDTAPGDAEDMLNIKDLLLGYSATTSAITNFLMMTTDGADTLVSVDRDGTGTAYGFAQIARIEAVIGLEDEQALLTNGNLIAA